MTYARYWMVILLLALAVAARVRRGDVDRVPQSTPLTQFPPVIGSWSATDIPMDQEVLDVLGKGFFLNRNYTPQPTLHPSPEVNGPVSLFIGYFPTQRSGQSIHSPQNCLPGSGWTFESSGTTDLAGPNGKTERVGDFIIADGTTRAEVLYWYQSHGRAIASDYTAKLYMLADSIRYNRSDAALVRIVLPLRKGESAPDVHRRAIDFAQRLLPILPGYIPN